MSAIQDWESPLISLALEASGTDLAAAAEARPTDDPALPEAYAFVDRLTARHSRSFHLATRLLPSEKRRACRALYAFCRTADDLVDRPGADPASDLHAWRHVQDRGVRTRRLVALAWRDTQHRYQVPQALVDQLIDGVSQDLTVKSYATFEELSAYCYGVASTVGLMSMHIIGFSSDRAIPYAVKMGVALQLTNILRDVGEDWRAGRLYLPLDELRAHEIDQAFLDRGEVTDAWRDFMRFQILRANRLYREAWPGIAYLSSDGRFAIAAAASLYRQILNEIESLDFGVLRQRAFVPGRRKASTLARLWLSQQLYGAVRLDSPAVQKVA
jgi:phytoene synthase